MPPLANRQEVFMALKPSLVLGAFGLVIAPLLLAGIELFHPAHFTLEPGMSAFLSHPQPGDAHYNAIVYFGPEWWLLMHMIQTPLVVIVSFGLLSLTDTFGAQSTARGPALAWISRIATVIFMTYYTVLDGIGGIGLGRQLIVVKELMDVGSLTAVDAERVRFFLDRMWVDPWVGGVGSFISLTGSWAVFVAAVTAVGYLWLNQRASWLACVLLLGFGWELQVAHASYHGPIAFTLLAAASTLILKRRLAGSNR
jgi:hypothetical protein